MKKIILSLGFFVLCFLQTAYAQPFNNYSLSFDGVDDVFTAPVSMTATDNITLMAWVKIPSGVLYGEIVRVGNTGGYSVYIENGKFWADIQGLGYIQTNYVFVYDQWTHIAMVRNAGTWSFYVNGVSQSIVANAGIAPNPPSPPILSIGDRSNVMYPFFRGQVDDVKLFSVPLSASDIQANMASQATNTTGLEGYWNFDQIVGQVVPDVQTNVPANDGIIGNTTATESTDPTITFTEAKPVGNTGLYFDGSDDYVTITDNPSLNQATITVEAWIKPARLGISTIISKQYTNLGNHHGYSLSVSNDGRLIFSVWEGNGNITPQQVVSPPNLIKVNRWDHVAAVYQNGGSGLTIYVNGIAVGTNSYNAADITLATNDIWIGNNPGDDLFAGQIDEVKIFGGVRTPAQIIDDMGSTSVTSEVAYWKFDDGSAGTAIDQVNNPINNGILTGAIPPLWAFRVTNILDDGLQGSLRWAINQANTVNITQQSYLDFSIQQSDPAAVSTITLASALPDIFESVIIDGYSAYGSSPNTNAFNLGNNAEIRVEIDGAGIGANSGLRFTGGTSVVRGLSVYGVPLGGRAIEFAGATGSRVQGCYIGLRTDGVSPVANDIGITLGSNNILGWSGTLDVGAFNIVSGSNFSGVETASNCVIQGNYIGTDKNGTTPISNEERGIVITGNGTNTQILNNLISGNGTGGSKGGIYLQWGANNTVIKGNWIGIDINKAPLQNTGNGITIDGNVFSGVFNGIIGGTGAGEANIIANNTGFGVQVQGGSFGATNHRISGNSIYGNDSGGISLTVGGNSSWPIPVINVLTAYSASGTSQNNDIIELFEDTPAGTGNQGRKYLGTTTADAGGNWTFTTIGFPSSVRITATATSDPLGGTPYNTSAFAILGTTPLLYDIVNLTNPTRNQINVPLSSGITAEFSVDADTPDLTKIKIFGSQTGFYGGSFDNSNPLTFTPNNAFKAGETITVEYLKTLKGIGNEEFLTAHQYQFTAWAGSAPANFITTDYMGGAVPSALCSFDYDNDGDLDLAVGSFVSATGYIVGIKINTGNGVYSSGTDYPLSATAQPYAIVALDADADGNMDLAVVNRGDHNVSIFLNSGASLSKTNYPLTAFSYPNDIVAFDADGDGDVDLATSNDNLNSISILINDGTGVFSVSDYSVGTSPMSLAALDADSDGDMDLAVGHRVSGVYIMKNNGTGNFTFGSNPKTGASHYTVHAFNADTDSDVDLAVAVGNSLPLYILSNDGTGVFSDLSVVNIATGLRSIISLDADGDSDLDLAVASENDNTLSLLQNDGFGVFTLNSTLNTGLLPFDLIAADIDGDTDMDLGMVNSNANTYSILFNTAIPLVVTNTSDNPLTANSLPWAITEANKNPDLNEITFALSTSDLGYDNVNDFWKITLTSIGLPTITQPVIINGYSQAGATPNDNPFGQAWNGVLKIQIDGNSSVSDLLTINASKAVTIKGLNLIGASNSAILLSDTTNTKIQGCLIGTNIRGESMAGNVNINGLIINGSNKIIGGNLDEERNVISGNSYFGVQISANNNKIIGNYIGTDIHTSSAVPNGEGIQMSSSANEITQNLISGNTNRGINLFAASNNIIKRNRIGTDGAGLVSLPNLQYGISLDPNCLNNSIGVANEGNTISANSLAQIYVEGNQTFIRANYIGTNLNGEGLIFTTSVTAHGIHNTGSNTIGGANSGDGNIISGNTQSGIYSTDGNLIIQNNSIGISANSAPLRNNEQGILLRDKAIATVQTNEIAYNGEAGIRAEALSNTVRISQNNIYNNGLIGIDLANDSTQRDITPNDLDDSDFGTNGLMNYPEFQTADLVNYDANGDLVLSFLVPSSSSYENYPLTIEFFISDGRRQGKTYIGSVNYDAVDAEKFVTATFTPLQTPTLGSRLVATATDINGNTSEFSTEISVGYDCPVRPYVFNVTTEANARCSVTEHEVIISLTYDSPEGYYNIDWDGDGYYDEYYVATDENMDLVFNVPDLTEIYYPIVQHVDYQDCPSEAFYFYAYLDAEDVQTLEIDDVTVHPPSDCENTNGEVIIALAGQAPTRQIYYDIDLDGDGEFEYDFVPDNAFHELVLKDIEGGTPIKRVTIRNSFIQDCMASYNHYEEMPFVTVAQTDLAVQVEKSSLAFEEKTNIIIENAQIGSSYRLVKGTAFTTVEASYLSDFVVATESTLKIATSKLLENTEISVLVKNPNGCMTFLQNTAFVTVADGIFQDQWDILKILYQATGGAEWANAWQLIPPYRIDGVLFDKGNIISIDISNRNVKDQIPASAILSLPKLQLFNIESNKLTFKSLQGLANAPFLVKYKNQERVNQEYSFTTVEGSTVKMHIEIEGRDLQFQWYKDGKVLEGETFATLTLSSVTLAQAGVYHASAYSKDLPQLIILRNPIKLGVTPKIATTDLSQLKEFYDKLGGKNWTVQWDFNDPNITNWFGLVVQNGKIISVSLVNNNLQGEISGNIFSNTGFFANLENLNLSGNPIKGKLPDALKNLKSLKRLDLSGIRFDNDIWEIILEMPNLEVALLNNMNITYIPENIDKLLKLKTLLLGQNQVKTLPLALAKLEKLQIFQLTENEVEEVPDIFANLKNLERLYFGKNKIRILPKKLGLTSLIEFDISGNRLSELPDDLQANSVLEYLDLSNNLLDFADLEKILLKQGGRPENVLRVFYTPQARFGLYKEVTVGQGETYTISPQTTGKGNTYTWLQNGVAVRRLLPPSNGEYMMNNINRNDAGVYAVSVTNPIAPDLVLYSYETKVVVSCATQTSATLQASGGLIFCENEPVEKSLTVSNLSNQATVQWFLNGFRLAGATNPRLSARSVGTYTALVTDKEGCSNLIKQEIVLQQFPSPKPEIGTDSSDPVLLKVKNAEKYANFQWFKDYAPMPQAIGQTWRATELGLYQVRATDLNGCVGISNVFAITPTATEQSFENEEIRIYPNPANEIIRVEVPAKFLKNYQINLWNAQGQEVRQWENQPIICVGNLPSGLYLLKISGEGKEIWRKVTIER